MAATSTVQPQHQVQPANWKDFVIASAVRRPIIAGLCWIVAWEAYVFALIYLSHATTAGPGADTWMLIQNILYGFMGMATLWVCSPLSAFYAATTPQRADYTGRYHHDLKDPEPRAVRARRMMFICGWILLPMGATKFGPAVTVDPYIWGTLFMGAASSFSLAFQYHERLTKAAFYTSLWTALLAFAWETIQYRLPGRAEAIRGVFVNFDATGGGMIALIVIFAIPSVVGGLWVLNRIFNEEMAKKAMGIVGGLLFLGLAIYGANLLLEGRASTPIRSTNSLSTPASPKVEGSGSSKTVVLSANYKGWMATGLRGTVSGTSSGEAAAGPDSPKTGPDGLAGSSLREWQGMPALAPGFPEGSLVGKDGPNGQPFLLGSSFNIEVSDELLVAFQDVQGGEGNNLGEYTINAEAR